MARSYNKLRSFQHRFLLLGGLLLALLSSCSSKRLLAPQDHALAALLQSSFSTPHGSTSSLSSQRTEVTLVHLWASWCSICAHELPLLQQLKRDANDPRFSVLTLTLNDSPEAVQAFLRRAQLDLPTWIADEVASPLQLPNAIPCSLLLLADGSTRYPLETPNTREGLWTCGPIDTALPEVRRKVLGLLGK